MNSASSPANILDDLQQRGLLNQTTPGLAEHLSQPRTLYCGFDPTADSLHIGSLVPLLTLKRFQQAGHRPIVLVGGATGMIGDPSFKAQERKLNTEETVRSWAEKLKTQTSRFVDFTFGENRTEKALLLNNHDWTDSVSILHFLRDIGKHFSVNNLINKEAIRSRLEREDSGISFTEFTYPLLQAFDFLHLFKMQDVNCTLQIGGSDQWGNMVAGTELIRKTLQKEAHVLTLPLVTKADGTKFGKTESGTIWLSAEKTSPYKFYQFWYNTADADVEKFLHYFSLEPINHIKEIMFLHNQNPSKRIAQSNLAYEITKIVHGKQIAEKTQENSIKLNNNMIESLDEDFLTELARDCFPAIKIDKSGHLHFANLNFMADLIKKPEEPEIKFLNQHSNPQITLIDALIHTQLATSKREAREFLSSNAIEVNGQIKQNPNEELHKGIALHGKFYLLRRGKKHNYALLILE